MKPVLSRFIFPQNSIFPISIYWNYVGFFFTFYANFSIGERVQQCGFFGLIRALERKRSLHLTTHLQLTLC